MPKLVPYSSSTSPPSDPSAAPDAASMAIERALPKKRNPLLAANKAPPHDDLVQRRRLGSTNLAVKAGEVGTSNASRPEHLGRFEYAHLRAPLPADLAGSEIFAPKPAEGHAGGPPPPAAPPTWPEAYFLMRRSSDGHVSATGMFKASFPWATHDEEEAERAHLRALATTSQDEIAGNVWITEEFALQLADDYGVAAWVRALLDPAPVLQDDKRPISPPPTFVFTANPGDKNPSLAPPLTPANSANSARGRGRPKAGSPVKNTPATATAKGAGSPKKRSTAVATAKAIKEQGHAAARQASESLQAAVASAGSAAEAVAEGVRESPLVNGTAKTPASATAKKGGKKKDEAAPTAAATGTVKGKKKAAATTKKDDGAAAAPAPAPETVQVEVQSTTETRADGVEGERTSVKVSLPAASPELPLPESTEAVIATARDMVAEVRKLDGEGKGGKRKSGSGKRKLDEVLDSEAEEEGEGGAEGEGRAAKKARLMEQEVRKQRVRNRALFAGALTLAVGAAIPYVIGS